MIIIDVKQGSPEWHAEKAGVPGSSNFDKIVTSKGDQSKGEGRTKYMYTLAGEKITGQKTETYTNAIMQRGIELEPKARESYEAINDVKVEEVGFCYPDKKKLYGSSPDGLVGKDGLLEIKCPLLSTHVGYLIANKMPTNYFQQAQGQLLVTGRKWVDFMSFYPGMKPFIIRVERDEAFLDSLKFELELFCAELAKITERIK